MHPVDMDRIVTWPDEVAAFLTVHSRQLRAEREADHEYTLAPSTYCAYPARRSHGLQ